MSLSKLGHVELITPNFEQSLDFFRNVVGLQEVEQNGDTAYLRAWGDTDHHSLALTAGKEARMDHVGWRTGGPDDLEQYARTLRDAGFEVTDVPAGTESGQGDAIRFDLTSGQTFELFWDMDKTPSRPGQESKLKNQIAKSYGAGVSPRRVDHLNINVADPSAIHTFLSDTFGFKMREVLKIDGFVPAGWMAVTALSHDIGVMHDEEGRQDRFHHIAYYCDNWHDVLRAAEVVREAGLDIDAGPGKHGGTQGFFLYFKDPGSGHRVEIFSGGYLVFDPDHEAYEWGPEDNLADMLVWYGDKLEQSFLGDTTGPEAPVKEAQPA
jgi:catechol 2,3 dioxygenase